MGCVETDGCGFTFEKVKGGLCAVVLPLRK